MSYVCSMWGGGALLRVLLFTVLISDVFCSVFDRERERERERERRGQI